MQNLETFLSKTLTKETTKNYLYEIKKYRTFNPKSDKYKYHDIMQYINQLRGLYTPNTVERIVFAIKKYYDYLIEIQVRNDNPTRAIKLRDAKENPIQLQDLFTEKELQSLLNPRIERYPFLTKRNQIIMSLLINQGLKIAEIGTIKLEDLNLSKATISVHGTGHTNSRILDLKAEQILLFHEYINQHRIKLITFRTKDNHLLLSKLGTPTTKDDIHYLISTYQNEAPELFGSNKKLTSVTIRQSVIANLLLKNNDLRIVQEFAGHKHLDTTEKYKETGLHALKTAIDKLHPIR